jgi:hypothetical protein
MAAASDKAPAVVKKPLRSMNSPYALSKVGLSRACAVLGADSDLNYFQRNSLQVSVNLLLICIRPTRYIFGAIVTKYITLQGINTNV